MAKDFIAAVHDRRTIYAISKESPIPAERIQKIIEHAVKHSPSAFNSQSARAVLLFGGEHDKLWDIVMESLRKVVPENSFSATEAKINSFKNGFGTVLYFEDQSIVQGLQQQFPTYADNFPVWSLQSSGMLQFVVWTSLEAEGLGASLQHYNPLIDDAVKEQWNLPAEWKLLAEMPFGKPTAMPDEKEFKPLEERIRIFK